MAVERQTSGRTLWRPTSIVVNLITELKSERQREKQKKNRRQTEEEIA